MSHIWDLPPTSGSIIWARQVERQLNTYMKRVEDVLGKRPSSITFVPTHTSQ